MRVLQKSQCIRYEAFVLYLYFLNSEEIQNNLDIICRVQRLLEKYEQKKNLNRVPTHMQSQLKWDYLMLGDSLVMATKERTPIAMKNVVEDVINLETELADYGILVCGGLGCGSVCWLDKKSIVGEGVIKVSKLARHSAIYPKIVFNENLYTPELKERGLVRRTSDPTLYFLDYLYPRRRIRVFSSYLRLMRQIQKFIRRGLNKYYYQKSEYIQTELSNYLWLKRYFQRNLRFLPPEIARELSL